MEELKHDWGRPRGGGGGGGGGGRKGGKGGEGREGRKRVLGNA